MKTLLGIIGYVLGYSLMGVITIGLSMYIDRKEGLSANEVYTDMPNYVGLGIFWVIWLPLALGYLLNKKLKPLLITIVETLVALEDKENTDES